MQQSERSPTPTLSETPKLRLWLRRLPSCNRRNWLPFADRERGPSTLNQVRTHHACHWLSASALSNYQVMPWSHDRALRHPSQNIHILQSTRWQHCIHPGATGERHIHPSRHAPCWPAHAPRFGAHITDTTPAPTPLRGQASRAQVHDGLVRGHHDGRVRDLTQQLCVEAAVQAPAALLPEHEAQRLPELVVLVPLLPQARPRNL